MTHVSEFGCRTEEERLRDIVDAYNRKAEPPDKETGYDCPICLNKRQIAFVRDGEEFYCPCECTGKIKSYREIKSSGLGNVENYTLDKFQAAEPWQKHIKEQAQTFLTDPRGHWFFAGGQVGAGKTHICTAITLELIKQGLSAKYMVWRETVSRLNSIANDTAYTAAIQPYKDAPVLYIDDLFKTKRGGNVSQGEINRAFEIINARYTNEQSITLISSELTQPQIHIIDEGTASRIKERTGDYCINIGKDESRNQRLKNK